MTPNLSNLSLLFISLTLLCTSVSAFAETQTSQPVAITTKVQAQTQDNAVATYQLDYMIDNFIATKANTVELALFKPVAFTASIVELPYNRKHGYLSREIKRFSPNSNIVATKGITLASDKKQEVSVYIIDELAAGMETALTVGDKVNFQAYHVYNSMNGPGLLVYQWEALPKPNLLQRTWSTLKHSVQHWFSVEHDHESEQQSHQHNGDHESSEHHTHHDDESSHTSHTH